MKIKMLPIILIMLLSVGCSFDKQENQSSEGSDEKSLIEKIIGKKDEAQEILDEESQKNHAKDEFSIMYKDSDYKEHMLGKLSIDSKMSIEEKLNIIAKQISEKLFDNKKIDILKVEDNIAYIDLVDNNKEWYNSFQGSCNGIMTSYNLSQNLLQPNFSGKWIDGIYITYNNEVVEMDHAGVGFFGTVITRESQKPATENNDENKDSTSDNKDNNVDTSNMDLDIQTTASSYLETDFYDSKNIYYDSEKAVDSKPRTSWIEASDGDGIDEWIKLDFGKEIEVDSIYILNGMGDISGDYYYKNNRVKKMLLEYSDGKSETITLEDDNLKEQEIKIDKKLTSYIKFSILEVYSGSKYDDTCIGSIGINKPRITDYSKDNNSNK